MGKRRHRVTVSKRNLFGSRMWWATCTCGWFQGNHHLRDSGRMAAEHLEKVNNVRTSGGASDARTG